MSSLKCAPGLRGEARKAGEQTGGRDGEEEDAQRGRNSGGRRRSLISKEEEQGSNLSLQSVVRWKDGGKKANSC